MMFAALFALSAHAADVYVNGVKAAGSLPAITMENVTVRFDAAGNVYIEAPQYQITVVKGSAAPPASPYPAPPYPAPTSPAPASTPQAPAYAPPAANPAANVGIKAGTWWLVTEDNDSVGQDVEVSVNGTVVRHVRSGEAQAIVDLGPYLRTGANTVTMGALPGSYGGGALVVYMGRGTATSGTVRLDNPELRYTRRAVDLGGGSTQTFTINVL